MRVEERGCASDRTGKGGVPVLGRDLDVAAPAQVRWFVVEIHEALEGEGRLASAARLRVRGDGSGRGMGEHGGRRGRAMKVSIIEARDKHEQLVFTQRGI